MVDQQAGADIQFLLSDFNTRLRDIDERNKLVRERVLLLGKNLLSSREEIEETLREMKRENEQMHRDLGKLKRILSNVVRDVDKFVKREEMMLVERMLKDFQPLEFMRKKDVEALIQEALHKRNHPGGKHIKTRKTMQSGGVD